MNILFVEDDSEFRETAIRWLTRRGHVAIPAETGQQAIERARERHFDVAIVDLKLPDMSGLDVLRDLKSTADEIELVMLTGSGTIETAVEAMRRGAYDYVTKPFPLARLEERCQLACERSRLLRENRQLRSLLHRERQPVQILGNSNPIRELLRLIERIAPTDKPVLILGESGTGKELVARAVQERSLRADRPFVVINCAALPENLVESELFGHEKGAFTGAHARKEGLFEVADGGTLFIDEIGELPLWLQPKLLRVLENGSLRRVGGQRERIVDVRLIAATNRDIQQEVAAGRFREDLYYRINVLSLTLPPLRERMQDLPLLIEHFLPRGWKLDPPAELALQRCGWAGNVRQLINVLERAAILADDRLITVDDLPAEILAAGPSSIPVAAPPDLAVDNLAELERAHVLRVLRQANGNKSQAARLLGVHRRTLYRLLERLTIPQEDVG